MSFLDRPLRFRQVTQQEVLAVLRRFHHVAAAYGEAERGVHFDENTTIRTWLDAIVCGELGDERNAFGECANRLFDIHVAPAKWREVLSPPKKRTLGDLCEFIAQHASVPVIEKVGILGKKCAEAGAFLAIRGMFGERGIDVSDLSPASSLDRYGASGFPEISNALYRLQPRLMYRSKEVWPSDIGHLYGAAVLVFAMLIFGIVSIAHTPLWLIAFMASLAAFVLIWKDSVRRRSKPQYIKWKRLQTFRDLCRMLAA